MKSGSQQSVVSSGDGSSQIGERLQAYLYGKEILQRRAQAAPLDWTELLLGKRRVVYIATETDSTLTSHVGRRGVPAASCPPRVIFPGSFNPPHRGHARMVEIASCRLGDPVWLEISITNVDKPPLDFLSIRERLDRLTSYNVCLTRATTFVEKAEQFPAATFVVGADTLARITDSRYYHDSDEERDAAIGRLERAKVHFLVFGRSSLGRFLTLEDLSLPPRLAALCECVPESEFREDISSTDVRVTSSDEDGDR